MTSRFDMLMTQMSELKWHLQTEHQTEIASLKKEIQHLKDELNHVKPSGEPDAVESFAHWHHKYGMPKPVKHEDACGSCANLFMPGESFCRKCGAQRDCSLPEVDEICSCHATFLHDAVYCRKCGSKRPSLENLEPFSHPKAVHDVCSRIMLSSHAPAEHVETSQSVMEQAKEEIEVEVSSAKAVEETEMRVEPAEASDEVLSATAVEQTEMRVQQAEASDEVLSATAVEETEMRVEPAEASDEAAFMEEPVEDAAVDAALLDDVTMEQSTAEVQAEAHMMAAYEVVEELPLEALVQQVSALLPEITSEPAPSETTSEPPAAEAAAEIAFEAAPVESTSLAPPVEADTYNLEKNVYEWSVDDVAHWVRTTGCGKGDCAQVAELFREEKISGDLLMTFSKDDYKSMGLPLGDIKRMEMAVDKLRVKAARG